MGRGGYTYTLSSTFCWLNVSALDLGGFSEVPRVVRYITSSSQRADSKNVNHHPHCFRPLRKRWHFHARWKRSRGRCAEGLFVNQMLWVFLNSLWRCGVFTERVRKHPKLFPSAILKDRGCSHGLSCFLSAPRWMLGLLEHKDYRKGDLLERGHLLVYFHSVNRASLFS